MWEADCQLSGTGTAGRFQRETATAGAHHQTGEFDVALFAGGGGTRRGAQPAGMAQPVLPPDDAPGTKDRQSRLGPETGCSLVLDVAQAMGLRAAQKVRFARGTARKLQWCAVEHRAID
jgi:hypothetical protein